MSDIEGGPRPFRGAPMEKVVADLFTRAESIRTTPQEYVIEGDVRIADLRPLVALPFETNITERRRKLILGTGTEETASSYDEKLTGGRMIGSNIAFHTHRNIPGVVFNAPSLDDLHGALLRGQDRKLPPSILAHRDGLLTYAVNQEQFELARSEMAAWLNAHHQALRHADTKEDIETLKLQAEAQREFAEKCSAIIFECTWDDKAGTDRIVRMFHAAIE